MAAALPSGAAGGLLGSGGHGVIVQQQAVTFDFAGMRSKVAAAAVGGSTVTFDLLPGASVTLRPYQWWPVAVDEAVKPAAGTASWGSGGEVLDSSGKPVGWASLSTLEANGVSRSNSWLTATFSTGDRMFRVEPVAGDVHLVAEVDPDRYGAGLEDAPVQPAAPAATSAPTSSSSASSAGTSTGGTEVESSGGAVIDVLVLYTPAARATFGGSGSESGSRMLGWINDRVNFANLANQNSGVGQIQWRSVGAREVNHTSFSATDREMSELRDTSKPLGRVAQMWRDQLGADLVALVGVGYVTPQGKAVCGSGQQRTAQYASHPDVAFSLLRVDANGCERTLAHEMGHNLGLHHDWRTYKIERSAGDSIGIDNHGFVSVPGDFATVMAYNDPDCKGGSCEQIPYWSNADVSIRGYAAGKRGTSESEEPAESYRTVASMGPTIAKFRATAVTPLAQAPYWAGWDIAADLHLRTDGAGGYTLDGYGGIHNRSGAPAAAGTPPYWPNLHIARGLSLIGGTASGVTLDGYGGVHKWGPGADRISTKDAPYAYGSDFARAVALVPHRPQGPTVPIQPTAEGTTPDHGGVTLKSNGQPVVWGGASVNTANRPNFGFDAARGIVVIGHGDAGGYVLDLYGGIHGFGLTPSPSTPFYYSGSDWFRGLSIDPAAKLFAIDRYGGIYAMS